MPQHATPDEIWRNYRRAELFRIGTMSQNAQECLESLEPHVRALPEILKDHLNRPATPTRVMQARMLFVQYLIDQFKLVLQPHQQQSEILAISCLLMSGVTSLLKSIEVIEKNSTKEQHLELLKRLGLRTQAAVTQFNRDSLTIDDILLFEPGMIVNVTL